MTFRLRQAVPADADDIAAAHVDSIRTIGPSYYPADVVSEWSAGIQPRMYVEAMAAGEVFFIAIGALEGHEQILGFSSCRLGGDECGTAVYVRGQAVRQGVGSALFRTAEAAARATGAASIKIDASLAALEFYRSNGFEETGRGVHTLRSGRSMACVFMRKDLAPKSPTRRER
jgi:putative acetyltransferase